MTTDRRVARVGVIGAGSIGSLHAQNLATGIPNARLEGIADADPRVAQRVASTLAIKNVSTDYRELLKNDKVEGVVIAVPTYLKRDMLIAAAEAGKHIFCEKPMALDLVQADEILRAVAAAGVKFQVGFMRRFDPSHIEAKRAISEGRIGKLQLITSHDRDSSPGPAWAIDPKKSGGIFFESGIHDFDVVRWLADTEVTRVYAEGTALSEEVRKNRDFDNVVATLRLASGAVGHVDSSAYTIYGHDQRVEILGTEGAILMSIGTITNTQILRKDAATNVFPHTYVDRFSEAYRAELADFADCILQDRKPRVTEEDGRAAVEIGQAARISANRSEPVSLPLAITNDLE